MTQTCYVTETPKRRNARNAEFRKVRRSRNARRDFKVLTTRIIAAFSVPINGPRTTKSTWKGIKAGGYGWFQKLGTPQIIHFNRVFHYKPSILGYPHFSETSILILVRYPPWNKQQKHLKMDGWKTSFLLGWLMFRGYVTFGKCTYIYLDLFKGCQMVPFNRCQFTIPWGLIGVNWKVLVHVSIFK